MEHNSNNGIATIIIIIISIGLSDGSNDGCFDGSQSHFQRREHALYTLFTF